MMTEGDRQVDTAADDASPSSSSSSSSSSMSSSSTFSPAIASSLQASAQESEGAATGRSAGDRSLTWGEVRFAQKLAEGRALEQLEARERERDREGEAEDGEAGDADARESFTDSAAAPDAGVRFLLNELVRIDDAGRVVSTAGDDVRSSSSLSSSSSSSSTTSSSSHIAFGIFFVALDGTPRTVYRRHSQFAKLHADLSARFPTVTLPKLPTKSVLKQTLRQGSELAQRRKRLQRYLNALAAIELVAMSEELQAFLYGTPTKAAPSGRSSLIASTESPPVSPPSARRGVADAAPTTPTQSSNPASSPAPANAAAMRLQRKASPLDAQSRTSTVRKIFNGMRGATRSDDSPSSSSPSSSRPSSITASTTAPIVTDGLEDAVSPRPSTLMSPRSMDLVEPEAGERTLSRRARVAQASPWAQVDALLKALDTSGVGPSVPLTDDQLRPLVAATPGLAPDSTTNLAAYLTRYDAAPVQQYLDSLPNTAARRRIVGALRAQIASTRAVDLPRIIRVQACVRRHLARRRAAWLRSARDKRHRIVKELVATERVYVNGLTVLLAKYAEPLRSLAEDARRTGILSSSDVRVMFGNLNINQLYATNVRFYDALMKTSRSWHDATSTIGDLFLAAVPKFAAYYPAYFVNFDSSNDLLNRRLRSNDKFRQLCDEIKREPECNNLDVISFLIQPIQRLPRYALLLDQLVAVTPHDHPDAPYLLAAVRQARALVEHINSHMRTRSTLAKIARELGSSCSMPLLDAPFRSFVGRFDLVDVPKGSFILTSDLVIITIKGKARALWPVHLMWASVMDPTPDSPGEAVAGDGAPDGGSVTYFYCAGVERSPAVVAPEAAFQPFFEVLAASLDASTSAGAATRRSERDEAQGEKVAGRIVAEALGAQLDRWQAKQDAAAEQEAIWLRNPKLRPRSVAGGRVGSAVRPGGPTPVATSEDLGTGRAVALFDFVAREQGDLELRRGDVVEFVDYADDEPWWTGSIGRKRGIFPAAAVKLINVASSTANEADSYDSLTSSAGSDMARSRSARTPGSSSSGSRLQPKVRGLADAITLA